MDSLYMQAYPTTHPVHHVAILELYIKKTNLPSRSSVVFPARGIYKHYEKRKTLIHVTGDKKSKSAFVADETPFTR